MATECLLIDANDPKLTEKVEALKPTPGLCIFLDITGSTAMKSAGIKEWVSKIYNCFENSKGFLSKFQPVKSIGDALMFYVEEVDLAKRLTPLQAYDALWQIATETGAEFPNVKIGAVWCEDVYAITFLPGSRDYYGIDIDMTARIQHEAKSREVAIDARFHDRVMHSYNAIGNQEQFESVRKLRGPEELELKGIPGKVTIYRGS